MASLQPSIMDQQRFLQQLYIVLNPSRGSVKDATSVLQKEFYPKPESGLFLLQLVTSNNEVSLKQLAAVEARTVLQKHWLKLPSDDKSRIRQLLLETTLNEPEHLVRNSVARIISAVARIDLTDGEWADLPGTLVQTANSPSPDQRAVGIYILYAILDTPGAGFQDKFVSLINLLSRTIQDPVSAEVRINSLLALGNLAMHLDSDEDETPVRLFQGVIPLMVGILKDAITANEETRVMQCFEVFQTLITCDPLLLKTSFKDLLLLMKDVAINTEFAEDSRTQALSFLMEAVRYRKHKIQALQIGGVLTLASLQIVTELDEETSEEDDINPSQSALALLDLLSQNLPPSEVVVPLLQGFHEYCNYSNADYRRAGILSLGMCVEGSPDYINSQMDGIYPVVLRLLTDPEPNVRKATLHGVARLADAFDDVSEHQKEIMPLLVQNLSAIVQQYNGETDGLAFNFVIAAVTAIDAMVSCMNQEDIVPYQVELVPTLHRLFQCRSFRIKGITAGALGSIARSADQAFLPYLDQSMHLMQDYVRINGGQDELDLRANVIDSMGDMSAAAGPDRFQLYVQPLMQATEEALHLDNSRLKETAYMFWGTMSKVYGEKFTPFLEATVKCLFACIDQSENETEVALGEHASELHGQEINIGGRKFKISGVESDNDDDDDDDAIAFDGMDDDDDDDDWEDLTSLNPVALEKEIAIDVVGDVMTHVKKPYLPYFEATFTKVAILVDHPYEGVRKAAINTLHRSYATLWQICEESGQLSKWAPGKAMEHVPVEISKLAEVVISSTIQSWSEESDMSVVSDISRNVAETLRFTGPYILTKEDSLDRVIGLVKNIILKKHPCQYVPFEEEEIGGGSSEFDFVVIDSALDVIGALAEALGPEFLRVWPVFSPVLLSLIKDGEVMDRVTAIGVFADVISGMDDAVSQYTGEFFQVLLHCLDDPSLVAQSNAAYGVGRLIENTKNDNEIIGQYPIILHKLDPLLAHVQHRDNAVGCLSRMILKHREQVPLSNVLPVIAGILPLKDSRENEPVYKMICQLYASEDVTIKSLTSQLIPVFSSVLTGPSDSLSDERRTELIALVKWLNQMQPGIAPWIDGF